MWGWIRRPVPDGFPKDFRAQRIGVPEAAYVCELAQEEIVEYFRRSPESARKLIAESYDKRYSPSTFITEESWGFQVGWYSRQSGYECTREFSSLEDAAADYLLFSLGKGRWAPPGTGPATRPVII